MAVVVIVGGYACGQALAAAAVLGSISFLLLGIVAGMVTRGIVGVHGTTPAALVAGACWFSLPLALVFHIRLSELVDWDEALQMLGPQLADDSVFAAACVGCAVVGGLIAARITVRNPKRPTSNA